MVTNLVHMTAIYSNAVLAAILPHISEFAGKLNLPVEQPITINAVIWSKPSPYKGMVFGSVLLTNHYFFYCHFRGQGERGYVQSFRSPTNWFFQDDYTQESVAQFVGKDNMTTNEAIELARDSLRKLGYTSEMTHDNLTPTLEGPYDLKTGAHVPYCRVIWDWPKIHPTIGDYDEFQVDINMNAKTLVGMLLSFSRTNTFAGEPIKADVVPELESDYRKRMATNNPPGKIFINTNAPQRFPNKPPEKN